MCKQVDGKPIRGFNKNKTSPLTNVKKKLTRFLLCTKTDNGNESEGQTLLMVVLVCVALVAGLILIVSVLALCVARQCRRLQLHEENMAAAAVKLTAVNRLRPKSTNLDYQYNLYMHRYR